MPEVAGKKNALRDTGIPDIIFIWPFCRTFYLPFIWFFSEPPRSFRTMFDLDTYHEKIRVQLARHTLRLTQLTKVRREVALCAAAHNGRPAGRLLALLAHDIDTTQNRIRPLLAEARHLSGLDGTPVNPDAAARLLHLVSERFAALHDRIGAATLLNPADWDTLLVVADREAQRYLSYMAQVMLPAVEGIRALRVGTPLDKALSMVSAMFPLEQIRLALGVESAIPTAPTVDVVLADLSLLLSAPLSTQDKADQAITVCLTLLDAVQKDVQARAAAMA